MRNNRTEATDVCLHVHKVNHITRSHGSSTSSSAGSISSLAGKEGGRAGGREGGRDMRVVSSGGQACR